METKVFKAFKVLTKNMAIICGYYLLNVKSDNKIDTHVYYKTILSINMRYTCVSLLMIFYHQYHNFFTLLI